MEKRYSEDVKRMDRNVSSHTENFSEKTVPEIPVEGAGHDVKKLPVPSLREVRIGGSNNVSRSDLLAGLLDDLVSNSGSSPALHREGRLDWSPFPALLLKTDTNEWIEDTGRAEEAVRPPQGVIKSEKMLWKQPGLRLLDSNDESDDEMEEDIDLGRAMSSPPQSRVPQKRTASNGEVTSRLTATISPTREKMDIDNVPGNTRRSMTSTRPLLPPNALKVSVKPPTWQEKQESSDETAFKESHITKSTFSASGSIATFLDLRGKKFKRTQPPKQACKDEISSDPIRTTQSAGGDLQRSPIIEATGAIVASGTVQVPATPYNKPLQLAQDTRQSVKALIGPRAIVLDTAMLRTQRPLISYLEHHGDGLLTMIFRDLSAGEIGKPGALSDAPDIILNPRTALFCTHFQALNQKNLPGQSKSTKQAMVQSKILKLTQIYDHLFVLVTMPANGDGLLPASQDTIASFTGFCSGQCIQGTRIVSPIWIPGAMPLSATSPNLYSCTWDLLCRQAFPVSDPIRDAPASAGNVLLIHDETLWELFLRKTGLNPMAAQVVFVMLKRPDGHDFQAEQGWGLRRLVQMRPIERLDMFAEILGRRMVERLSMVLATMHN
ncbi:hypothetical protein EDD37DRAFT_206642 [Exophiala viscosa]|uniref:Uncharacterized protein n=1 Tax=Exophiala viscosa TaxID=2486360 RepID=A0AAN6E006_9EURO|nr:hypothetical protein EDD36DRAFT_196441 [Exophiala viscosa]KAI1619448.1 hypothetical protein EDD37DRAFT_206642 [Exophiala viscosa]